MPSPDTTWSSGQLNLAPSRHYLLCWWLADAMAMVAVWRWPPWPVDSVEALLLSAVLCTLLLGHGFLGWRRHRLLALTLDLLPEGGLALTLADGRRYRARLARGAGISGWVCRLELQGASLPRFLRPLIIFRDSLDEARWRRLCRWLVAHSTVSDS